jgi:hypothetical protein
MGIKNSKNSEDFHVIESIDSGLNGLNDLNDSQLINQVHRKMKLMDEMKNYIKNANKNTTYHKYIVGTLEYEEKNNELSITMLCSNMFLTLYRWELLRELRELRESRELHGSYYDLLNY